VANAVSRDGSNAQGAELTFATALCTQLCGSELNQFAETKDGDASVLTVPNLIHRPVSFLKSITRNDGKFLRFKRTKRQGSAVWAAIDTDVAAFEFKQISVSESGDQFNQFAAVEPGQPFALQCVGGSYLTQTSMKNCVAWRSGQTVQFILRVVPRQNLLLSYHRIWFARDGTA
jgi:hypothetical protein